jgi:hypothetical protein
MASGSFNLTRTGGTSSYLNFVCNWSSYSNGTSANSSTLSVSVYATKSSASTSNTWGTVNTSVSVTDAGTQTENGLSLNVAPNGSQLIFAKNFIVPHKSDGSKSTTISVNVGGNVAWGNGSATVTLDKIPRQATITVAPDFNDEENPTITYSNPAGNSVTSLEACISLTGSTDDIKYRAISKTGTSYTFNLTDEERATLRNATKTSNSRNVMFFVKTVISGTTYYSTKERTLSIINATPTTGTFEYKDTNNSMINITQNNQRIIRNHSNLVVVLGTATAKKGATISKYEVSVWNKTKSSTTATNLDFGTINLSSNTIATLEVTDSRGNVAKKEITIIIDDWVQPTGLIDIKRKNNFYSETYIKVDGSCSSLNGKNYMMIQYKYKKVSDTNYSSFINLTDNVQSTVTLDNQYQWNIVVRIADKIGETSYNLFLDRGMPIIFFDRIKSSVGVNCFPSKKNGVEVNGLDITNTYSTTEQKIGIWKDGRTIYRLVLETGALEGADAKTIAVPKDIHTMIKPPEGMMYDNVGNGYPLTYINTDVMGYYNIGVRFIRGQGIYIKSYGDFAITSGHVIIEYTKTTD